MNSGSSIAVRSFPSIFLVKRAVLSSWEMMSPTMSMMRPLDHTKLAW